MLSAGRVLIIPIVLLLLIGSARADLVTVRFAESASHGFLRLRNEAGKIIADGESSQRRSGSRLVARMLFRFRDGSIYDETTTYTQDRQFRLVSEHVIQRGPSFPESQDLLIDASSGQVTVKYTDKGEAQVASEHMDLPADLANGIIQTLLKNAGPTDVPRSFSYIAATPKPRLVKLEVSIAGKDRFYVGILGRPAVHYALKVALGGITGVIAPVVGKQPPDSHIWILHDGAPMFVRAQMPFFSEAPLWTIELAAPTFAAAASSPSRTEKD